MLPSFQGQHFYFLTGKRKKAKLLIFLINQYPWRSHSQVGFFHLAKFSKSDSLSAYSNKQEPRMRPFCFTTCKSLQMVAYRLRFVVKYLKFYKIFLSNIFHLLILISLISWNNFPGKPFSDPSACQRIRKVPQPNRFDQYPVGGTETATTSFAQPLPYFSDLCGFMPPIANPYLQASESPQSPY